MCSRERQRGREGDFNLIMAAENGIRLSDNQKPQQVDCSFSSFSLYPSLFITTVHTCTDILYVYGG